jgi:hypothetical protein
MQNLVLCFAGGTGGHFIANLCHTLLYQTSYKILDDGSVHSLNSKISSYLSGRLLDNSIDSLIQEYNVINSMGEVDLALGHFRNLSLLQQQGKKVIYIEFQSYHKEEIYRRLHKKVSNKEVLTKETYDMLAGADWPSWEEYQTGAEVSELDPLGVGLKQKDDLGEWYFILPVNQTNICKITFDEILRGYELVDKLADFLKITDVDKDKIRAIINEYRGKQ